MISGFPVILLTFLSPHGSALVSLGSSFSRYARVTPFLTLVILSPLITVGTGRRPPATPADGGGEERMTEGTSGEESEPGHPPPTPHPKRREMWPGSLSCLSPPFTTFTVHYAHPFPLHPTPLATGASPLPSGGEMSGVGGVRRGVRNE